MQVVLLAPDEVAEKAVILLKDIFTNLGPRLQQNQVEIHEDFIGSCIDRLKALFDTVSVLEKDHESTSRVMQETIRMVRILNVLKEYVAECDEAYGEERVILPLSRWGKLWIFFKLASVGKLHFNSLNICFKKIIFFSFIIIVAGPAVENLWP